MDIYHSKVRGKMMKRFSREFRSKNLWGYILSFSAIMVFIFLIMGSYLYWFYYNTVYTNFKKSNLDYLSAVSDEHENNMSVLNNIMTQLSLMGGNVEFSLHDQPQKSIELKKVMNQYLSVSQFFDRCFFFYHGDSYLYNQSTSINVSNFVTEGIRLEKFNSEQLKEFLYENEKMSVLSEQKIEGYLVQKSGRIMESTVIYSIPMEPKKESTILFLVGGKYYDKLLGSESNDKRRTFIFYQDVPIVARGNVPLSPDPPEKSDEEQYVMKKDGEKYLVTWMQGESGLLYCTVQSEKIFQNNFFSEQWGVLLILAICSIPTAFAFLKLSKSLSEKVRSINILLGTEEYYNMENMENGVRVLVENHKESNEEHMLLRRTRFISEFVRGQFADRDQVICVAKEASLNIDKAYYVITLMGDYGDNAENVGQEMMLHAISEKRVEEGYGIHLINSNQSLYVLFSDSIKRLEELLKELFIVGKNCCEEFVMSVSDFHSDFCEAPNAYLEADSAYSTRLLVDNGRILYFTDIEIRKGSITVTDPYLHRLRSAIRDRNETEVKKIIQEICDTLRSSGQSLLTFRILCNNIIYMLFAEGKDSKISFEDTYSVFSLAQCLTLNDFHDILWEVCSKLMEAYPGKAESGEKFVGEAIENMKQNYQNTEFNMATLAEQLGVSSVTLAIKFKNAMEISPSDYLTILRMEQAKVLLKETDLKVKEISVKVGYMDVHVFIRKFKKYTGTTPGQYRVQAI